MKRLRAAAVVVAMLSCSVSAYAAVVVELFTSQGCSSCPPADALLREFQNDPGVIPIAYHVDYWNGLGWRDPFSSRDWTVRQMAYVHAMQLPSAYTPQMVVGGTRQMVGSSAAVVRTAIAAAARESDNAVLMLSLAKGVAIVNASTRTAGLDLIVVATDDEATTRVEGGENGGRTLVDSAIARKLVRVRNVPAGDSIQRVPIEGRHIVAMLQDPKTLRIVAAVRK
jgi:hypothetical protein